MLREAHLVRIFLASPSDVAQERKLAKDIIEALLYDPDFVDKVAFRLVAWDNPESGTPMLANLPPQIALARNLPKPSECDIVIVILWARIGTPLSYEGKEYLSGTHYEFEDALQAAKMSNTPKVLIYRRTQRVLFDPDMPDFMVRVEQHEGVKKFFGQFTNSESGQFVGGYNEYEQPEDFRRILERHLRILVKDLLLESSNVIEPQNDQHYEIKKRDIWSGSPFLGLESFTEDHAPIFFGRGREIDGLIEQLKVARLVAVVGASGSGKSSLVRAGVIPNLRSNAISSESIGSKDWYILAFTPGKDPFRALAEILIDKIPSLQGDPIEYVNRVEKLATTLHYNPENLALTLKSALQYDKNWSEVLLFIDQFEELFTLTPQELREPFAKMLTHATYPYTTILEGNKDNKVRVVLTLRADFYHYALPLLTEPLRTGTFTLDKPDSFALLEMIKRPAERADLKLDDGLSEKIVNDMGNEPGALALMAYTLDEMYKIAEKRGDRQLRYTDYEALGRVYGAIGKRASDVFEKLDIEARSMLPYVFRELVAVNEEGIPTRKRAPLSLVADQDHPARLVHELTIARLLVQSKDDQGVVVEVAHEALFSNWHDLAMWIADNKSYLFLLQQVRFAAALWHGRNHNRAYLWIGERSNDIQAMIKHLDPKLSEIEKEFCRPETEHLLEEIQNINTSHLRRSEIGFRLHEIGDPRPHIGLCEDGFPDIKWLPVQKGVVKISGVQDQFAVENFYIAKYLITHIQFQAFLNDSEGYDDDRWWLNLLLAKQPIKAADEPYTNYPRDSVSWFQSMAFANWLNAKLPRTAWPQEAQSDDRWQIRLPTEWEWQQAAIGEHKEGEFFWGKWDNRLCNTSEAGIGRSTAVGMYPHSVAACGALDMFGNLYEWCLNDVLDPRVTSPFSLNEKILRGGAFWHDRRDVAATYRGYPGRPQDPYKSAGLRVICGRPLDH